MPITSFHDISKMTFEQVMSISQKDMKGIIKNTPSQQVIAYFLQSEINEINFWKRSRRMDLAIVRQSIRSAEKNVQFWLDLMKRENEKQELV